MNKLSIIIPVFNEGKTVHLILDKIKRVALPQNIQKEIIIVNDCSTDNTSEAIKNYMAQNPELEIILFEQDKNQGKGAALHTGISKATGEYLVFIDADVTIPDINNFFKQVIQEFQKEIQTKDNSEELLSRDETCKFLKIDSSTLWAWAAV